MSFTREGLNLKERVGHHCPLLQDTNRKHEVPIIDRISANSSISYHIGVVNFEKCKQGFGCGLVVAFLLWISNKNLVKGQNKFRVKK